MKVSEEQLIEATAYNGAFSKTIPGLQTVWDSSSLGPLKECPQKYFLSIIMGYQSAEDKVDLVFGKLYHAALEFYDHRLAEGMKHHEALVATTRWTLENSGSYQQRTDVCPECRQTRKIIYTMQGAPELGNWFFGCPNCQSSSEPSSDYEASLHFVPFAGNELKHRESLVRSVVWYIDHFQHVPTPTVILANGKPAVELSFKIPLDFEALDGTQYTLAGHLDRVVEVGDAEYVMDRKTTKSTLNSRYFEKYTPDNQMTLYTVAGKLGFGRETRGVIVDAAQLLSNATRFSRGFAQRAPGTLEEWLADYRLLMEQNERYVMAGYWPHNDTACDKFFGCQFRDICSKSPNVRKQFLDANFVRRTWDPTVPR